MTAQAAAAVSQQHREGILHDAFVLHLSRCGCIHNNHNNNNNRNVSCSTRDGDQYTDDCGGEYSTREDDSDAVEERLKEMRDREHRRRRGSSHNRRGDSNNNAAEEVIMVANTKENSKSFSNNKYLLQKSDTYNISNADDDDDCVLPPSLLGPASAVTTTRKQRPPQQHLLPALHGAHLSIAPLSNGHIVLCGGNASGALSIFTVLRSLAPRQSINNNYRSQNVNQQKHHPLITNTALPNNPLTKTLKQLCMEQLLLRGNSSTNSKNTLVVDAYNTDREAEEKERHRYNLADAFLKQNNIH